jgi:hypothetical protein
MRRPMTGEPILGSSLTMVEAAVNIEDIDQFDFGTDWWATEVADEFKVRQNWSDRGRSRGFIEDGHATIEMRKLF